MKRARATAQSARSRFPPDAQRLRDFATQNAIPFTWIDLESDEKAETLFRQFGVPPSATPVVIGREGRYLTNPTVAELGHGAGLEAIDPSELHDLIAVGRTRGPQKSRSILRSNGRQAVEGVTLP